MRSVTVFGVFLLALMAHCAGAVASIRAAGPAPQVVDRILVRVEDDIITLSEMRELASFQQLVDGRAEPDDRLITELIEQWVVNREAAEARFPQPAESEVSREVQRIESSFANAPAYNARLAALGLAPEDVKAMVTRQIYLARYLDYKFRPAIQVDEAQIAAYYKDQLVPRLASKGQQPPPEDTVRAEIREVLMQQAINDRTASWFEETKSRLKIEIEPHNGYGVEWQPMSDMAKTARRWKRLALIIAVLLIGLPLVVVESLSHGAADDYIRRAIVAAISKTTRHPVELQGFHFDPWQLRVTLRNLTVHGREPAGTPPFFHADSLDLSLRVDSFWGRKFSLGSVELNRPALYLRIEPDGSSNVPAPRLAASGKPLRQRIFEVVVRRLRLDDGEMIFNDVKVPLVAQGGRFDLAVDYADSGGRRSYLGELRWQQMEMAARRYLPFSSNVVARFSFAPDSFSLTQFAWTLPHASIDAQMSVSNFANPLWNFQYRGNFDFEDIRTILRKPTSPAGRVSFTGDGRFAAGKLAVKGRYSAEDIAMRYQWFHARGISSRGSYFADRNKLEIPDFFAQALAGNVTGRVQMDLHTLQFRVNAHAQGLDVSTLLAAVDNENLPIVPLHWAGSADVQALTTWTADFKNMDSRGVSVWTPPAAPRPGEIPVMAQLNYHYSMAARNVSLNPSQITTPSSRVQMSGTLGARNSALDATFDSQDLGTWDDFITRLRGKNAQPKPITGRFHWQGEITGPLVGPTFTGQVNGSEARYDRLYWDQIAGEMVYSPEMFQFVRASARRGSSSAQIELSLTLDDWSFLPRNPWSFDATLVRTDTDGIQALLGSSFPAHGLLTGTFHVNGTREFPQLTGLFDVVQPEAWGWRFDRARGEISMRSGEVRISNAELRLLPPPAINGVQTSSPPGLLTGNFVYHTADRQVNLNVTGAALPLEGISRIQTPGLPVGGRMSFHLSGEGPLLAPKLDGSMRLVDLRLGSEVVGSFDAAIQSDGARLALQLDSAMATGALHGAIGVSLRGNYPIAGKIGISQLDLDPLIVSALHLTGLTGHSHIDGQFSLAGDLIEPDSIVLDADLSHVSFDYAQIKLENAGPVKFQYRAHEIQVQQANLRGADTDFAITGLARFAGNRSLDLHLSGAANLRLFGGFVPQLDARGPAQMDAVIAGSLSAPLITGHAHVENAAFRYGDFPAGLSQVNGDLVFDSSRLVLNNVTSQIGGGQMQLAGSLTYGNGPVRYDLTARAAQVRIRYPAGMSWLAGGTLRLAGNTQGATLSGAITVDRLLMSEGFDLASLIVSSNGEVNAPVTSSAYLRNLQFDIQADAAPGARLEWPSGDVQTDASVRLRGTWEHPILLGNVHLLAGQMTLRGNQYRLSRGDINFVNPFRADPVLNVEATTTIQRYDVTVDFTGPASHLIMSYRSDPPLPPSDIITLLALGQTGEESQLRGATAAQTPEMGATTLLSEAVSSQLGSRVQRLFGISHFSVDPSYLATTTVGQNPGARVTIGQQFSRNLVITYSTDVTSTQEQIIQIEYTVRPDLSIIALRDENGTFGVDIVRRKRFR